MINILDKMVLEASSKELGKLGSSHEPDGSIISIDSLVILPKPEDIFELREVDLVDFQRMLHELFSNEVIYSFIKNVEGKYVPTANGNALEFDGFDITRPNKNLLLKFKEDNGRAEDYTFGLVGKPKFAFLSGLNQEVRYEIAGLYLSLGMPHNPWFNRTEFIYAVKK